MRRVSWQQECVSLPDIDISKLTILDCPQQHVTLQLVEPLLQHMQRQYVPSFMGQETRTSVSLM